MARQLTRKLLIPERSGTTSEQYTRFIQDAYGLMAELPAYFSPDEDVNCLELAHLLPEVPETALAIYVGINDAACNKGLVTALLPQHGHNNVFVFDSQVYSGDKEVPSGTVDAKKILAGFEPPNNSWKNEWTYVMVADPKRTFQSLWVEKGYIDMIPAKFEDFTMLTGSDQSKACIFISPRCFDHPVNASRPYLKAARQLGEATASQYTIPGAIADEFEGLTPIVLEKGQKLYVATTDFSPCAHGWVNVHPSNKTLAVVNENSAVPLDLVIAKPPVNSKYAGQLIPPKGSADMTTDWFYRGEKIMRKPLLAGLFKG